MEQAADIIAVVFSLSILVGCVCRCVGFGGGGIWMVENGGISLDRRGDFLRVVCDGQQDLNFPDDFLTIRAPVISFVLAFGWVCDIVVDDIDCFGGDV